MGRNKELNKLRKRNQTRDNAGERRPALRRNGAPESNTHADTAGEEKKPPRGVWGKLWAFMRTYPLLVLTTLLSMPRVVPWCTRWVRLRSGLMGPVIDVHAEKQVLILGALGSGTATVARALQHLGVEVGHDVSDSTRALCRDGTISWSHAIRFLRGMPNLLQLCAGPRHSAYHSTMIRPSRACSRYFFRQWNDCWADECREVTAREFGCALNESTADGGLMRHEDGDGDDDDAKRCSTPFRKILLQVRHPLQFVAFLAQKSSSTPEGVGTDCSKAHHQLATITALFPNKVVRENLGSTRATLQRNTVAGGDSEKPTSRQLSHRDSAVSRSGKNLAGVGKKSSSGDISGTVTGTLSRKGATSGGEISFLSVFDWAAVRTTCVETWAWYWIIYNTAVLKGGVDGWYRVEDTPPSEVAILAGFTGKKIDEARNVDAALVENGRSAVSHTVGNGGQEPGSGPESEPKEKGFEDDVGFMLTWDDLADYPNDLLREISDLAIQLGYEGAPPRLLPEVTQEDESENDRQGADDEGSGDGGSTDATGGGRRRGWRGLFGWGRKKKGPQTK